MYPPRFIKLRTIFIALSFVMSQYVLAATSHDMVRLNDNSDWWSLINPSSSIDNSTIEIQSEKRKVSKSNMQILGVMLKLDADVPMYKQVIDKLGKAKVVTRGDAHRSRSQVCYVSIVDKNKVYLVFEQGEMDTSFYLFEPSSEWDGANYTLS